MSEQLHTPGPWLWHYNRDYNTGYVYTPEHKKVWDGRTRAMTEIIDEQRIAKINPDWCQSSEIVAVTDLCHAHFWQVEANARLIAAAPALLAALETLLAEVRASEAYTEDFEPVAEARAAIAAAKGAHP
jgi:hypothetical protein